MGPAVLGSHNPQGVYLCWGLLPPPLLAAEPLEEVFPDYASPQVLELPCLSSTLSSSYARVLPSHCSAGFHTYQGQGQARMLLPHRVGC